MVPMRSEPEITRAERVAKQLIQRDQPYNDRIVAEYEFPYLAHTPMEPLNATIRFDGDRAEAWIPSQAQTMDQAAIAEVLGLNGDRRPCADTTPADGGGSDVRFRFPPVNRTVRAMLVCYVFETVGSCLTGRVPGP